MKTNCIEAPVLTAPSTYNTQHLDSTVEQVRLKASPPYHISIFIDSMLAKLVKENGGSQ